MADELYKIYETFTEQLVTSGWKGEVYGWQETARTEVAEGGWALFELDNGFRLGLNEPGEESQEEATLQYWFEDKENAVKVESLEQLLLLLD